MMALGITGRAAAAALGCGLLAGPTVASGQPAAPAGLFSTFKSVCAENAGAYARATAAPEVQAWKRINFPLPLPTGGAKLRTKTIRAHTPAKGSTSLFFAGTGDLEVGGRRAPFDMCAIGAKPSDKAAAVRQVQAWSGEAPQAGPKNSTSFRYHQTAGGERKPVGLGKLGDVADKLGPGTIVSIDIVPQGGVTVISYSTIKL
jgi:hypothetical protein